MFTNSERAGGRLDTAVRSSWTRSGLMPVPILGTDLSRLVQWLVLPLGTFRWASRSAARYLTRAIP